MLWTEVRTTGRNEIFRERYVRDWIHALGKGQNRTLLDVGAGNMPFRSQIENAGFNYLAHDFGQYTGSSSHPGLQAPSGCWTTSGHHITCDIVELPRNIADVLICTEVLEHVPDPRAALASISSALKSGGIALVTVPFQSRMHQAPFWFVSGLSPYWFEYHADQFGLQVTKLLKVGDFVDQMIQEVGVFAGIVKLGRIARFLLRVIAPMMRRLSSKALLESGGLAVYVEFSKSLGRPRLDSSSETTDIQRFVRRDR